LRSGRSGSALIYAHDAGENAWSSLETAGHFRRDFDVVLYDARGHGQSGTPDSVYSIETHVEDLSGLIRRLPVDSPVCMGRGMGANTVCWLAALHPGSVRALILIQPSGGRDPSDPDRTQPDSLEAGCGNSKPESVSERIPLWEAFERISCPVLILFTEEPAVFPSLYQRRIREANFSNIRTVFCRKATDRFAVKAIESFLHSQIFPISQNLSTDD
ncbi:alpha/beta hydrolase, partial [bacterium]|nr:alpha/beta hydrolase [bacterium]